MHHSVMIPYTPTRDDLMLCVDVLDIQGLFVFFGVKTAFFHHLHLFPDLLDLNLRLYRIINVNCFFLSYRQKMNLNIKFSNIYIKKS